MFLYDAKVTQILFIKRFLIGCSFSPCRVEKEKAQAVEQQAKVSRQTAGGITASVASPASGDRLTSVAKFRIIHSHGIFKIYLMFHFLKISLWYNNRWFGNSCA